MALEMIPVAIKVSPDTLAILRSESELTGVHQNEIARRILKAWADERVHEANVRDKHLKRQGFMGIGGTVTDSQE